MAFSNGYTYRRTLTVDNTKVNGTGDLTNFPVLVKGTYSYLATVANAGKVEHASGYDIRFESTGDVKLDHEVVYWSATTGEVVIWVEVPTLDGDADTSFYMYYGNSSVSSAEENPTGVWDTNYKGVWHMKEDPTSVSIRSSSKNDDATGTAISVTAPSGTVAGDFVVCIVQANGQTTISDNNGSTPFTIAPNFTDYKPNTSNGHTISVFSRTIQAGDPSTYNFTSGASGRWSVIAITAMSDGTVAFDVSPNTTNATNEDDTDDGTMVIPAITTLVPDAINIIFGGWDTSAYGTITTPSGYTLLQNANTDGEPLHASYKAMPTAGTTGTASLANTEFAAMIGCGFSIKATAQLLDSTSNNYDMTTAGTMTSGDLITGQIYKAIDFDGTDDEAKNTAWASVIDENDAFTIEHWFNIASTPNSQMVAWGEAGGSNLCSTGTYGNNIGFLGYANDHVVSAAPYDDGNWHHLVVTHNGSTVKVIINGTEVLSEGMTMGTNAGQDLYFARWKDGGFYPAKLEEIRISTGARSNDWAITTYETSKNPSTFYAVGTETTSGGGGGTPNLRMLMGMGT